MRFLQTEEDEEMIKMVMNGDVGASAILKEFDKNLDYRIIVPQPGE